MSMNALCLLAALSGAAAPGQAPVTRPASLEDLLLGAVMLKDAAKVKLLLEQGASPAAKNEENDRTALFFAAEMGDAAIVRLLLDHGADVNAKDKLHGETPVAAAARRRHADVVRLLLARDASGAEGAAWNGLFQNDVPVLDAALSTGRVAPDPLSFMLDEAERGGRTEVAERLRKAGAVRPRPIKLPEPDLARLVGSYRTQDGARSLAVSLANGGLTVTHAGATHPFVPLDPTFFVREGERFPTLRFEVKGDAAAAVTLRDGDEWTRYTSVTP